MKALIKKNFRFRGVDGTYAGKWVEIDTKCLFTDQYNTTAEYGNMRIFDSNIERIEDDARVNKGRCKYCGKIVKRGEEEKHYLEEEAKKCKGYKPTEDKCFWACYTLEKPEKVDTKVEEKIINGIKQVQKIKTTTTTQSLECRYKDGKCCCDEHRERGISWFTEDNCYFLKYPNGIKEYTANLGEEWKKRDSTWYEYTKKFGSYKIELYLKEDRETINYLVLRNARGYIKFNYNGEEYIIYDGIGDSPRTKKEVLENAEAKCNEKINKQIKELCKKLYR